MLREYYKLYKPKTFLFEGQLQGHAYDSRSLQQVLKQAFSKAGIEKPVTLTGCATVMPHICSKVAQTCDTSKNSWGTAAVKLQKSIHTLAQRVYSK
jgi:hypothetical protein